MTELLRELAGAGALEARGGFTIDPKKAREKLRQYQLAEPQRYVLLLVEAAVSCGAERLEFEIDSDDLHLRFGGTSFRYEQLENIYGSLFASIGEVAVDELARLRGLRQLAFALNSAMALNPRYVRVVSVDAEGEGARLELRPDASDQIERISAPEQGGNQEREPEGNWIHVKDRFRPGLVVEFFRSLRGNLAELALLREHCRWSRAAVLVNGELISKSIEFEQDHWTAIDVFDPPGQDGERIGRAALGLCESPGPGSEAGELLRPTATLLSNGVFIERVRLAGGVRGFGAIVDSPRFGKDVSQTKLLRDEGFEAVMRAIAGAQARTIARLAERCAAGTGPSWGRQILFEWLREGSFGGLRRALREDEVFARVAEVPLWPVIGAAPITTRALIEDEGAIRFATESFEFAPLDVPFVLALADDEGTRRDLLDELFGDRLRNYTAALRREHERQRKRLEFMTRRELPELGEGYYLVRETFASLATPVALERRGRRDGGRVATIRGELGLRQLGHRDSWVRLLCEGCLLQEVALDQPVPGLCAVVQAELTPNDDYDRARPDSVLAAALLALLEALAAALSRLAASGAVSAQHLELRSLLRTYVREVNQADYAEAFLQQFGFSRSQAKRELDRLLRPGGPVIVPRWELDRSDEDAGERHPITAVPLYDRAHAGPRSLAELHARRAAGERLAWLDAGTAPLPLFETEVLLLERGDREALRALLGSDALEPFAEQLTWIRRRDAFLERPPARLELRHATLARAALRGGPIRGELGLREFGFSGVSEGDTPVRVYWRERELCELTLELPLPGLVAWVESGELELNASFDGLAHPLELRRPLLHGLVALVAAELDRALREPAALRRCEWWFLAMVPSLVFGGGRLAAAFMRLRAARGQDQALLDLDALLAVLERFPARDLERALGRLQGRDELPTPEAVAGQLSRPSRRPREAELAVGLRRELLASLVRLLELPLLRRFTGAPVDGDTPRRSTLAAQLDRVAAGEPIAWVGEDFRIDLMPKLEFEVLGLDPVEQRLLQDLVGAPGLELVGEWLRGRASFERRRTISEIRVPRGAALTTLAVSGEGWRGELGISRQPPSRIERSKIRVFTREREAAVVDLPAKPLALIGALAFDELELTERHDDVTMLERERVRSVVQSQSDALIRDLAARYPELRGADKARAAEVVRDLLVNWPPGVGGFAARANKRRALFRLLAELPVFAGARKPWSAVELAEARERGRIATVAHRERVEVRDVPVVVLDAPDVESTLRALFGELRDLHAELERTRAIEARKAAAPRLPGEPPAGALASLAVDGERLSGWLWIRPGATEVLLGADGRAADKRSVSAYCWCAGAITGEGLNIKSDWSRVILSRSQERLLERLAVELWGQLLDEFLRLGEAEAPRSVVERQRFVSVRDGLQGLFMRLHAAYGRGRLEARARKRKRKRGNRYERLYDRLCAASLLELSNGRWISAEVAERERPIELAALELWTGPSAEELAHQRAVERREAERRREEQLRIQREAEVRRRRLEAEAREREAERRRKAERDARRRAEREARERAAARRAEQREAKREAEAPSPEALLLEALREELRLVRARNEGLVSNRILDSLTLGQPVRRGPLFRHEQGVIAIDPGHRLFVAVLDGYLEDPGLLTLLASATYSYLNFIHREIADVDEAEFLRLHAAYAATSTAGSK